MADQNHGAGEFSQTFLQDFQSRDIQVIGRFIEQQEIGRLEHELRDSDARLFAAGKVANRDIKLLGPKKKLLRPGRDMQLAVAVGNGIAVGTERLP